MTPEVTQAIGQWIVMPICVAVVVCIVAKL